MRYSSRQLARALVDLIESEKTDVEKTTHAFIQLLADRHELKRTEEVVQAIDQIWIERHGAATIAIESAHPISASLRKQLSELAQGADLQEQVNEELIGGARVRIDDRVIDGSVAGALAQLKQTLYGN